MKIKKLSILGISLLFLSTIPTIAQQRNKVEKAVKANLEQTNKKQLLSKKLARIPYWYINLGMESPFMFGDMYSITQDKVHFSLAPNIRLGYRFNSGFALEIKATYGQLIGTSINSTKNFMLTTDGMTIYPYTLIDGSEYINEFIPAEGEQVFGIWGNNNYGITAARYESAFSKSRFMQVAVLANFNLNRLILDTPKTREQRVSLFLKPAFYLNKYNAAIYNIKRRSQRLSPIYSSPISIGLGGELALNIALSKHFGIELYSGLMWVSDQRFDGIQTVKMAKDDYILSFGANIQVKFNKKKKLRESVQMAKIKPAEKAIFIPKQDNNNFAFSTIKANLGQRKIKQIEENAFFQYQVSNTSLKPNIGYNQIYLNKIDNLYRQLLNDKDITIKSIVIEGYASPEGRLKNNIALADNRAKAIVNYLKQSYNFKDITFAGKGENWEGLRKALLNWDNKDKQVLIDIVNSDRTNEQKKIALAKQGRIYKEAVKELYPALRMNTCVFNFEIKPYTIEQCVVKFNTEPQKLSADEMLAVINQSPIYSDEFINKLNKALRYFPSDERFICYKAATLLKDNKAQEALSLLQKTNSNANSLNLMAVAYMQLGNKEKAKELLLQAKKAGNIDAIDNLKSFGLDK